MTDQVLGQHAYYEKIVDAGADRPWITMVHGAVQNSSVFSAQVSEFRNAYRILLIDLPGHGRSSGIPGPYGPEEYARSVLAAMDHAQIGQTHFWGTHTGAGVALLLATRQLDRFRSLILEGPVLPGVDLPSITATIGRAKTTARENGIAAARLEWFRKADWFAVMLKNPEQCRAEEHWSMIAQFEGAPWLDASKPQPVEPLENKLAHIARPVLIMNGEHDVDDFKVIAARVAARLPDARQMVIPNAGGFPLWEYPDLVNAHVKQFLESHP
jgi:pimeloyl-ACP methyl ester carboxylesterase